MAMRPETEETPKGKDEEMMTERRKRREWTLLAVVVLFWFAQYVYIPYQTPFLTGKGVAAWMIGTVVGAYGVTQMIFRLPGGGDGGLGGTPQDLCVCRSSAGRAGFHGTGF